MRERCRLHPLRLSLQERMQPLSTAEMTLPPDDPEVAPGSFVALYTPRGEMSVYRVVEATLDCRTSVRRLRLEHGLCTLSDHALMGEHVYEYADSEMDAALAAALPLPGLITGPEGLKVYLRASKSNAAAIVRKMDIGDEVTVLEVDDTWFRVACGEDTGWVGRSFVQLCEEIVAPNDMLRSVLADLLTHQGESALWQLGDVEVYVRNGFTFRNQNLLEALLSTASSVMEDCMWVTDQRTLPWTLHLRSLSGGAMCEMRMERSVDSMTVTVDASDLCTCMYPVGLGDVGVENVNGGVNYLLSPKAAVWGRVERLYIDSREGNTVTLLCNARKALRALEEPRVSVEISGAELSGATGEALDRLTIGRLCRVPLPQLHRTVQERIVELCWTDLASAPSQVRVTMANTRQNAASMLANAHSPKRLI